MPTLKKFPWVSLTLLLVTYSTLGWLLIAFHDPLIVWVIVVVGVLLLAAALSSPWSRIRDGLARLFKSDTRAFLVAVVAAFLSVVIITWLHIFAHALVTISAGTLVKLDAQTAGLTERQTFWLLSIVSLVGLGLGGVAQQMYLQTLI
jgi:hypothetical protein